MGEAGEADVPGWRCIILTRCEQGSGRDRHVVYEAQSQACGQPPQALRFRFSELVRLRTQLESVPELRDVSLPKLPPKITFRSIFKGQFDDTFHQDRLKLVQDFFDNLALRLGEKYAVVGDCTELCEPLGVFVRQAASVGETAEVSAAEAAERVARQAEDREIIAQQNDEFEESLRMDELRQVEEMERQEAERRAEAERAEAERLAEAKALEAKQAVQQAAEAHEEDIQKRRVAFEAQHPEPAAGNEKANIRFRAPSGATLTRNFPRSAQVSLLFEFVAVADWPAAPRREFDLRTSFPVHSLRESKEQTLEEAGLCPSAALLVADEES